MPCAAVGDRRPVFLYTTTMHEQRTYSSFIHGSFISAPSQRADETRRQVLAPADGSILAEVYDADVTVVDQAVQAACDASAAWAGRSRTERSDVLFSLADALAAESERLARIEARDTGRPVVETREDVAATVDQFRYVASAVRVHQDELVQHTPDSYSMIEREPYGVAGLIVPWNFPFLIAGWKLAPALAAGNTCVIKPAELAPLSILELARIADSVLPPGVLNVITGDGRTGAALCTHPRVDILSFTGSPETGRRVAAAAAERTVPCLLELGGKSANILFPDAPMEKALVTAPMSILFASGQMCNAGSRLLVHEDVYESVLEELVQRFRSIRPGDPLDETTRLGPLISDEQWRRVESYVAEGQNSGARLLCGGRRLTGGAFDRGYYVEPTLFADVDPDSVIAQEEIFGPVLCVIPFRDEAHAVDIANNSVYGLAGGVWTRDWARGVRVARQIRTGTVWVNEYNLVPSGSPFGGYRQSGFGREVHMHALSEFSQTKNIFVSLSDKPVDWYALEQ